MKFRGALALAIMLAALTPTAALAHAELMKSTPATDAVITELPPEIVLTFDDSLLPSSSFDVVDAGGVTVLAGSVDAGDSHVMRAATSTLANGAFEVRWTAATDDGHIERATFRFTVAVATPPAATPPSADDGDEASSSDVIVSIIAAIVAVAGGAFWLGRRRRPQA